MCKITAVDVGMCLPKCFVIIINVFTFFAILLFIIFACQVGIVYFVYSLVAKMNKSANNFLLSTIASREDNFIYYNIWEYIQLSGKCCGVKSFNDWKMVNETLPRSCCPMLNTTMALNGTMQIAANDSMMDVTCTQSNAVQNGCKKLLTDYLREATHPITVGVIIVLAIQLINLILACCMFFVYGRTQHITKRKTKHEFIDMSPVQVHDQFLLKKEHY
ncbi:hypothetical protein Bhyg_04273 [Pseudolycoriella hygida]|uniref:Tetraspanin n=1 Tax=Pseudolycoriella hygida TaxID=35572 RepID=A0A9Q0S9Z0_9DIPT|nr:hypothetical protein Bhyg_04273 [Pseudolycoriella hygida]